VAEYEEQERDAQLAAMDVRDLPFRVTTQRLIDLQPSNSISPLALSPGGVDADADPFASSFADEDEADEDEDDDIDDGIDWEAPLPQESHFAVLPSSLPGSPLVQTTSTHKRHSPSGREKRHKNPKWHFGIRSRSPRMEVMLEIYRTLKVLGMEWKEKMTLGGLAGLRTNSEKLKIERRQDLDGKSMDGLPMDIKAASSIYFVETRARADDIVVRARAESHHSGMHWLMVVHPKVLMDLQLYQVDDDNYLVDFKHQGYYKASQRPGAKKFDRAPSPPPSSASDRSSGLSVDGEQRSRDGDEVDNTVSPFLFMDTACRLIIELAGGGESSPVNAAESAQ
jgi:carbon catabolite-derepressing protein kinase